MCVRVIWSVSPALGPTKSCYYLGSVRLGDRGSVGLYRGEQALRKFSEAAQFKD